MKLPFNLFTHKSAAYHAEHGNVQKLEAALARESAGGKSPYAALAGAVRHYKKTGETDCLRLAVGAFYGKNPYKSDVEPLAFDSFDFLHDGSVKSAADLAAIVADAAPAARQRLLDTAVLNAIPRADRDDGATLKKIVAAGGNINANDGFPVLLAAVMGEKNLRLAADCGGDVQQSFTHTTRDAEATRATLNTLGYSWSHSTVDEAAQRMQRLLRDRAMTQKSDAAQKQKAQADRRKRDSEKNAARRPMKV